MCVARTCYVAVIMNTIEDTILRWSGKPIQFDVILRNDTGATTHFDSYFMFDIDSHSKFLFIVFKQVYPEVHLPELGASLNILNELTSNRHVPRQLF